MLITLVVVMIIIWAAVVWSIYSWFSVFYSNFSEGENYHRAYYASISALERWELVSKQRDPWYLWSGGFILWEGTGSRNGWWSDSALSSFSYLSDKFDSSTIFWNVNSRNAGRIPATWEWNVEPLLADTGSSYDYNIMDYENAEIFLLYYDNSEDNPYDKVSCRSWSFNYNKCGKTNPWSITWNIRLPKLLTWKFWSLNENVSSITMAGDNVLTDDSVVDRQIRWIYITLPFTIFSKQGRSTDGQVASEDTVFRESNINSGLLFDFGNSWNPIDGDSTSPVIISEGEKDIISDWWNFEGIFGGNMFSKIQIRFALLNLLKTANDKIYPYLEYYISFGWQTLPDKYFTIIGEWDFADYQVKTIIQKPTVKESILWNFTTVF